MVMQLLPPPRWWWLLLFFESAVKSDEEVCPFDPQQEIAALRASNLSTLMHVKPKYEGWAMFPRHVFFTGPTNPGLRNLTWKQGQWPPHYDFHYYDDERMSRSARALDSFLSTSAGVDGLWDAFDSLRAWAFKADLSSSVLSRRRCSVTPLGVGGGTRSCTRAGACTWTRRCGSR